MWIFQSLYIYLITGLIGGALILIFSRKFKNLSKKEVSIGNYSVVSKTLVIASGKECQEACELLVNHCQDLKAVGFDYKQVTTFGNKGPDSLLELVSVHGLRCLFRLNTLHSIPLELESILQNHDIVKVGVSSRNCAKLLNENYGIQVNSTLDLKNLYPSNAGFSNLMGLIVEIQKRSSDLDEFILTEQERKYAAKDAFVALEIFKKWLVENTPKLDIGNVTYDKRFNSLKSEISKFFDTGFEKKCEIDQTDRLHEYLKLSPLLEKLRRKALHTSNITRKTPLYNNCFMHAPDGQLLCSCDRRKAEWYIERGLAEVMPGEMFSIKLLFEPAARANDGNGGRFYQQLKQNCCVVCGENKYYLKHSVVPREYRKHFPSIMKSHQSHDVVLTCIKCHVLAAQHVNDLKHKLALMCNAPINAPRVTQSRELKSLKNFAKALLKSGNQIPVQRKNYIENEIKNYFGVSNLTRDILEKAVSLETFTVKKNFESHGLKVTNYFSNKVKGGLIELEKLWRENFLNTMKPKYLPALWSVNHNHSRVLAKQMEHQQINSSNVNLFGG